MMSALTDTFDIDFPLFAFSHCRDVVAAVSRNGGFGVFGAVELTPEQLRVELEWIRHLQSPVRAATAWSSWASLLRGRLYYPAAGNPAIRHRREPGELQDHRGIQFRNGGLALLVGNPFDNRSFKT